MRLIDADNFMAELEFLYRQGEWDKRDIHFSLADIECNLDMMPTIEMVLDFQAKTVRHGHWIEVQRIHEKDHTAICECSLCGDTVWVYDGQRAWNYCPNCGAKMDEVEND